MQYEMLEHTADIKIRAFGQDLPELFGNAARGMMDFLFGEGLGDCKPDQTDNVEITSKDKESLLVDWLSELNYLVTTNYRAYLDYDFEEFSDTHLKAKVRSCAAKAVEDIKAVTFHEMKIEKTERGWQATVVFDI